MSNKLIDEQTKKLSAHMNDYLKASELKKKGEAAIFDKHRLDDGQFQPGLNEELTKYRNSFADEWGMKGWRNEQFVKQRIEEVTRPSEEEVNDMHQQHNQTQQPTERESFINDLQHNSKQHKNKQGPKMN